MVTQFCACIDIHQTSQQKKSILLYDRLKIKIKQNKMWNLALMLFSKCSQASELSQLYTFAHCLNPFNVANNTILHTGKLY
jgi:hypothetical protein